MKTILKLFKINSLTILIVILSFYAFQSYGQDLEPRSYANVPVGINVIAVGYGFNKGNVLSDPALPIEDFKINTHLFSANYIRSFDLFGKLARVQAIIPMADMEGRMVSQGVEQTGSRSGFADSRIRFGVNLTGSPALDKKQFSSYEQKTIFGVSLVTLLPTGRYYSDKKINIGSNRWALKPEVGVSRRFEHLYVEAYVGVWFYTHNTEYLVDKVLKQNPALSLQSHASYYFKNQMWVGVNTTWYKVGSTTIDDVAAANALHDWRLGVTFSAPIAKNQSLRLQYNKGLLARLGLNYDALSLAYQYLFF